MKRFSTSVALAVVLASGGGAVAQDCPPYVYSRTMTENGQTIELKVAGVNVSVMFLEVTSVRIEGIVSRTSGGMTEGCVAVHWLEQGRTVEVHLDPLHPEATFEMDATPVTKKTFSQIKSLYR